ncbi:MAG: hypothetical protein ACREH4_03875 [Vitreimonas sp.]
MVLASSIYQTLAQAVASLTLFTHPDTVAQIPGAGALFPAVRNVEDRRRLGEIAGRRVGFDDNETAHDAFGWCNPGMGRWRDVQLNHVWSRSSDPDAFTAPANLCAAPSFLAKLTDHDGDIAALLRRRAFDLYGWAPPGEDEPIAPTGYASLIWADPLPGVNALEAVLRARLRAQPKCTAARIARDIGWAFSGGEPDPLLKTL